MQNASQNRAHVAHAVLRCLLVTGGANRDRTDDLLLAKQALSQLSYGPAVHILEHRSVGGSGWVRTIDPRLIKTVL
jgi:hypothetical protein